jgi:hypothetical protein
MQAAIKNNNKLRAYQLAIDAFDINPHRVKDILLSLENLDNSAIKFIKENFIKKEETAFKEALQAGDFNSASLSGHKLFYLTGNRKYQKEFKNSKQNTAENYLVKSTMESNITMRYRYICAAQELLPEDVSIKEQKTLIEVSIR